MRNKIRKSTWLSVVLLIYVSAMAVYMLPRNSEMSCMEKYITLFVSYSIVIVLWFVLRKKERVQQKQREKERKEKNLHGTIR
jgi:Na+/melibiose symporter-like transporter